MSISIEDPVDRFWSPLIVILAGGLFALPAVALITFGVLTLAG